MDGLSELKNSNEAKQVAFAEKFAAHSVNSSSLSAEKDQLKVSVYGM